MLLCVLCLTLFLPTASAVHSAMSDANTAVFDSHAAMGHSSTMCHDDDVSAGSSMCFGMICSGSAVSTSMPVTALCQLPSDVTVSPDIAQFSGISPATLRKPPKII